MHGHNFQRCVQDFVLLQQTDLWKLGKTFHSGKLVPTDTIVKVDTMTHGHRSNLLNLLTNKDPEPWAVRHLIGSLAFRDEQARHPIELNHAIEWVKDDPGSYVAETPLCKRLKHDLQEAKLITPDVDVTDLPTYEDDLPPKMFDAMKLADVIEGAAITADTITAGEIVTATDGLKLSSASLTSGDGEATLNMVQMDGQNIKLTWKDETLEEAEIENVKMSFGDHVAQKTIDLGQIDDATFLSLFGQQKYKK